MEATAKSVLHYFKNPTRLIEKQELQEWSFEGRCYINSLNIIDRDSQL